MIATSGARLLDEDATGLLLCSLIPRATVVTPNIPEALVLSGMKQIDTLSDMKEAGRTILDLGPDYVVMKGGHLPGEEAIDLLVGPHTELMAKGPKYPYDVHGSGCCFSAAMAGYLALGRPVEEAFRDAKEFVDRATRDAVMSRSGKYSMKVG